MDQRVTWRMVAADPAVTLPREAQDEQGSNPRTADSGCQRQRPGRTGHRRHCRGHHHGHGPWKVQLPGGGGSGDPGTQADDPEPRPYLRCGAGLPHPGRGNGLTLQPGGSGYFRGRVERDPLFDRPVNVQPENFPNGVLCESVQVGLDQEEFQIPCTAGQSVQPGEYAMELSSSSTLATRTETQVPYRIPSVATRLIVAGKESQEDDTGVASLRTRE